MYRLRYTETEIDTEGHLVNKIKVDVEFETLSETIKELGRLEDRHSEKYDELDRYSMSEFIMIGKPYYTVSNLQ